MKRILRNVAECSHCHDVIESHRAHDRVWCRCGAIYTDGGKAYIRRGYKVASDVIDRSEYEGTNA